MSHKSVAVIEVQLAKGNGDVAKWVMEHVIGKAKQSVESANLNINVSPEATDFMAKYPTYSEEDRNAIDRHLDAINEVIARNE